MHGATVNETRFQFYRNALQQQANTSGPEIQVLGSFNTGGAPMGRTLDTLKTFELQNNTTTVHGAHAWRFGIRVRAQFDANTSPQNFNGTFTFSGGLAPVLDANEQPVRDASGQVAMEQIDSIERYRRTLLGLPAALGGGASQFSINAGIPATAVTRYDAAVFVGDDWRLRPNLTLNLGLRYENQTNIHDPGDLAPRIGLAWAPGSRANNPRPKLVLRGGFGIFYDRFSLYNSLTAARYNGIVQQQYVVTKSGLLSPNVPSARGAGGVSVRAYEIQRVSPALAGPVCAAIRVHAGAPVAKEHDARGQLQQYTRLP